MLEDPKSKHALETVTNPYSGQSCQLPRYAVAVYDVIKGAEVTGDVNLMRKGLDWFQKNFTDQYYIARLTEFQGKGHACPPLDASELGRAAHCAETLKLWGSSSQA